MSVRDKLVYTTIELMRRDGVAGTGVAEILDRSGVSRRSIYLQFPEGKSELVTEATRVAAAFFDRILSTMAEENPVAAVGHLIDHWVAIVTESDFRCGCPVAAAALARSSSPEATGEAAQAFSRWSQTLVTALVADGIPVDRSHRLALTILSAIEGAIIIALASASTEPLEACRDQLTLLIDCNRRGAGTDD
ncbi:TetR/AcrR family transcriptional regulator [Gordonia jinhuaensis]|uniref:TetR-family transcriptional regulator n=1 Tax=Gordonia jinhuaensis TaxID=1517702 RepID=A0A916TBB6_9ACTN|nr:TetR/AcrR family transcriptional regulator [Gordonia jinhuaensis]GGB38698.1 putative TetR-family transcriptional regulator [Gordonia jinhuaensis]